MASDGSPLIAASILTADFGRLDRVVHKLERAGVDRLHLDVMDGHFVPNLTFGPDVAAAFRRLTTLPIDVHLMISHPSRYVERFIDAEPETITFHVEAPESDDSKHATLARIGDAGIGPGLAISPDTPLDAVRAFLDQLEVLMILTVQPGWGGQRFMADAAARIGPARQLLATRGGGQVHVDGGVNRGTAALVGAQGVDVCIVGSALFQRGRDASDEVRLVRERWQQGRRGAVTAGAAMAVSDVAARGAAPRAG